METTFDELFISDQLSYGHLLLVEDNSRLIPPACILVSMSSSERSSSAVCATASAYKFQAKSCLICRKKASCPISFS